MNFLHYFQLIAAIPPDPKRKVLDSPTPDLLSVPLEYHQEDRRQNRTLVEDRTLVLSKLRCKDYYKIVIEKLVVEQTAVRSWNKYLLEFTDRDWVKCFAEIYKSSKDNNLRQFSLKVLHRIIPTKKELKKYNLTVDVALSASIQTQ